MKNELAYLSGLIMADGHIDKRDFTIHLYIQNKNFREKIKRLLKPYTNNKIRDVYHSGVNVVSLTDKKFAGFLIQKYGIPPGNKAGIIRIPAKKSRREILSFIEGYFDGDGSIYTRKVKTTAVKIKVYREIKFKSKSKIFLLQCQKLLHQLKIGFSDMRCYDKQVPYFVISRKEDIDRFFKIFKPRLKNLGYLTRRG